VRDRRDQVSQVALARSRDVSEEQEHRDDVAGRSQQGREQPGEGHRLVHLLDEREADEQVLEQLERGERVLPRRLILDRRHAEERVRGIPQLRR
jgi:hypothetical protein